MEHIQFTETWDRLTIKSVNDPKMKEIALGEFYHYLYPILLRKTETLLKKTSIRSLDAYDLLTIAFVKFMNKIKKDGDIEAIDSIKYLENYLFRIIKNEFNNYSTKRGIETLVDFREDTSFEPIEEMPDINRITTAADANHAMDITAGFLLFKKKNPFCHKLIEMKVLKQLRYDEILRDDEFLSLNYNSIKERKQYCQKSLKSFLLKNIR